jgi:phosphoheptose isomerase
MKLNKKKNSFIRNYFDTLDKIYKKIDYAEILVITEILLEKIKKKKNIYVAGNGGSASIANHLLCDFNKGIKISSSNKIKPKIISLTSSIETITAISNDISYEKIFSFQLENYYKKDDCLICFSSSGQSKNIINVINFAKKNKVTTILFQGFGKLNKGINPDYFVNLNYKNYGITEDIFQSIMHAISQHIRLKFKSKNEIL